MNLYVREAPRGVYSTLDAILTDAEGDTVGRVSTPVANWLVRKGIAYDMREEAVRERERKQS